MLDNLKINYIGQTLSLLNTAIEKNISAFKLSLGARTILSCELSSQVFGRTAYICADSFLAKKAFNQISCLTKDAVFLPPACDALSYRDVVSSENYVPRLAALFAISQNPNAVVVTCAEAVAGLYPLPIEFKNASINLKVKESVDLHELTKRLINAGYKKALSANQEGDFSVRGDILDIFCIGDSHGTRLEFFGDEIESIRHFDLHSLKSGQNLENLNIAPATEIFYHKVEIDDLIKKVNAQLPKPKQPELLENYHRLLSKLTTDLSTHSRDMRLAFLMPLLKHSSFIDFVDPQLVFFDDAKQVADSIETVYSEAENRYKALLLKSEVLTSSNNHLVEKSAVVAFKCPKTAFHALDSQNRLFTPDALFNFSSFNFPNYSRDLDSLLDDVSTWTERGNEVVLFAGSKNVKENLEDFFARSTRVSSNGNLKIAADYLEASAAFFDEKVILIATPNLVQGANQKATVKRKKRDSFTAAEVGGFVVHRYHGVGHCESIKKLNIGGAERDYVVIKYSGGDTLYVPVENMDSLSHYDNADTSPKLQKLGGAEFSRIKERVRESVKKMAFDLTELYAQRANAKGHKYDKSDELLDSFVASFMHTDTPDQATATTECVKDLSDGRIMDRLLCGDVGYGKTEVALRVAFKVMQEGKQVAMLAPTTILAKQHYATAIKRMAEFGIRVASLTRFDSAKNIAATLENLKLGTVDIVCGTHRLLSKDVEFKDLGLLILDEEQRFGVADKEKIKKLKNNINVLTLTATPIPRTLHLSLSGIRDISVLDTPPVERLPVKTYVTEYSEGLLYDAVMREVGRGGQVFIVYNRVESMQSFVSSVKSILPDGVRIAHAHGQMTAEKLEDTIADFTVGKQDVLIASTIIENGIDMPNANTLIVIDSDRFGLAQLYQLRGRVGRSNRLAYSYFTFDAKKILTENATKRLEAITMFTEFGSGFKIAMRDLEIRGAGNVLGREQHGHIDKVGYDMYCKILQETIEEAKNGEAIVDKDDIKVSTDFNAFLPDSYVLDPDGRQRVYSRVSEVTTPKELKELKEELSQIYGVIPAPLDNLLLIALVKNLCAKKGAISASVKRKDCFISFKKIADIPHIIKAYPMAKVDPVTAKINFGIDRENMIKFLLTS